jgi:hypothetical protein
LVLTLLVGVLAAVVWSAGSFAHRGVVPSHGSDVATATAPNGADDERVTVSTSRRWNPNVGEGRRLLPLELAAVVAALALVVAGRWTRGARLSAVAVRLRRARTLAAPRAPPLWRQSLIAPTS